MQELGTGGLDKRRLKKEVEGSLLNISFDLF